MTQPIDIQALRNPSPDRQALLDTLAEALDEAVSKDITSIRVFLYYAAVQPNGMMDRRQQSRRPEFPVGSSDPDQIADQIVSSYVDRAPGDGFVGKIIIVIEDSAAPGSPPLGTFERLVQIGDINLQLPGGEEYGGGRMERGGYGRRERHDDYDMPVPPPIRQSAEFAMGGSFGSGPEEMMQQEMHGQGMAISSAQERRMDQMLRQNQFLVNQNANLLHNQQQSMQYFLQLNALVMGRALPALDFRQQQGGGGNPIGDLIGGIIGNMLMGGQGQPAPEPPPPIPPTPTPPGRLSSHEDAYVPYEPPMGPGMGMGDDFAPGDITEDMAQEWASQNPAAAKRVAKGLLPPAMQKLIPK